MPLACDAESPAGDGCKRGYEAIAALWEEFRQGALRQGVEEDVARTVYGKLLGFATFGFPKAHSAAFALQAYESAWLKVYYPTEFCCALLNQQPMRFYSPAVLLRDAQRHVVQTMRPDINHSGARCTVEGDAIRLGFLYVNDLSESTAAHIEAERARGGPYRSLRDFVLRTGLRDGLAITAAGMVVCRQRPSTAKGFTFLTLEDEAGLINLIVKPLLYEKLRTVIRTEPFLWVSGVLQQKDGTTNIVASAVWPLRVPVTLRAPRSKDWG
jgi:DNA polymerase III alpha subunit